MSDAFEIVDRPIRRARRSPSQVVSAVLDTARTGRAVRFALNGKSATSWRSNIAAMAKRLGFKAHVTKDGELALIAWVEPLPGQTPNSQRQRAEVDDGKE